MSSRIASSAVFVSTESEPSNKNTSQSGDALRVSLAVAVTRAKTGHNIIPRKHQRSVCQLRSSDDSPQRALWTAAAASLWRCCSAISSGVHLRNAAGPDAIVRRSASFTFRKNSCKTTCVRVCVYVGGCRVRVQYSCEQDTAAPTRCEQTSLVCVCVCSCTHVEHLLVSDRLLHGVLAVVERVLPRVQQECETELARAVAAQRGPDRDEVLERLGHLAAVDVQVAGVQEVAHPVVVLVVRLQTVREAWFSLGVLHQDAF